MTRPTPRYRKRITLPKEKDKREYKKGEVKRLMDGIVREVSKGVPLAQMHELGLPHPATIVAWMDKWAFFHDRVARAYSIFKMMGIQECEAIADTALDDPPEDPQDAMKKALAILSGEMPRARSDKDRLSLAKLRISTRLKVADRAHEYATARLAVSKSDGARVVTDPERIAKQYCAAIMMAEPDYMDVIRKGADDQVIDYLAVDEDKPE